MTEDSNSLASHEPLLLQPEWPTPANVRSLLTTRVGGFSLPPYQGFNIASHVGDELAVVQKNRALLLETACLPSEPHWLNQIHSTLMVTAQANGEPLDADGSYTREAGVVCVAQGADCLPVLLCDEAGTQVAAVHAGWRGLLDGVLNSAIETFPAGTQLLAYLGPAIGTANFEVGAEVREAFLVKAADDEHYERLLLCFPPSVNGGRFYADIVHLARLALQCLGVSAVYGGEHCTYAEQELFYSYRRDKVTGRQAALIWLEQDQ